MVSASAAGPRGFPLGRSSAPGKSGPTPAGPSSTASPRSHAALQPCQLQAPPLPSGPGPHTGLCSFSNGKFKCHQDLIRQGKNAVKITLFPLIPSPLPLPSLTAPALIFKECFRSRISKWPLSLGTHQGQGKKKPFPEDNCTSSLSQDSRGHKADVLGWSQQNAGKRVNSESSLCPCGSGIPPRVRSRAEGAPGSPANIPKAFHLVS